jgi:hypothetical protein
MRDILKSAKNFLQKLILTTPVAGGGKSRSHKGKCFAFFQLCAFAPSWQAVFFAAKLRKIFL